MPRDIPLVPIRVESVFASKVTSEAKEQDDGDISLLDKTRVVSGSHVVVCVCLVSPLKSECSGLNVRGRCISCMYLAH